MQFNLEQAKALVEMFYGNDDLEISVTTGDHRHHSGPGLYAWEAEYPEEGSIFLGEFLGDRVGAEVKPAT